MAKDGTKKVLFPSKEEVMKYLLTCPKPPTRRELSRAFHIHGDDHRRLRELLHTLEEEGTYARKRGTAKETLPNTLVLEAFVKDHKIYALPVEKDRYKSVDPIFVGLLKEVYLKEGDRFLGRLKKAREGYRAHVLKLVQSHAATIVGGVMEREGRWYFSSLDRKAKDLLSVADFKDVGQPEEGMFYEAQIETPQPPSVRLTGKIGPVTHLPSIIQACLKHFGVAPIYPEAAAHEAKEQAKLPQLGNREDLRNIPLVTVDGEDAKDFDDAIWAEALPGGKGWHLIVAIADVSYYVRPGTTLDREAYARGNSTYMPEHVVPMLPEVLSNEWCSLKPNVDRACLAVHIWIDAQGEMTKFNFVRALMRSYARLTYTFAQNVHEDKVAVDDPKLKDLIENLYGAYESLKAGRLARGTLDLVVPQYKLFQKPDGDITIYAVPVLDSHQVIEEFMIAANVCAATMLEERQLPCMYRIHDTPKLEKVEILKRFFKRLGIQVPGEHFSQPRHFSVMIHEAAKKEKAEMASDLVLRSQAQAIYSPNNIGHFGLNLERYAHFTSPIRRYADLIVHRLIASCLPGNADGAYLDKPTKSDMIEWGDHISQRERVAVELEREVAGHLHAVYASHHLKETVAARASGVNVAGVFVTMAGTGGDGFIPIGMLPPDYYHYRELEHALVGRSTGLTFALGDEMQVRIDEADLIKGRVRVGLVDYPQGTERPSRPKGSYKKPFGKKPGGFKHKEHRRKK